MTQLKKVLKGVLHNWGHDIILQRSDEHGGFLSTLERHTVRHMFPAVRGLPAVLEERKEGVVHTIDMIYYFKWDAKPKEGDRIYEKDDRYPEGQTTWLIDYAVPNKGKLGQVDFWTAGVTRESPI